jgi:hypothetical protein
MSLPLEPPGSGVAPSVAIARNIATQFIQLGFCDEARLTICRALIKSLSNGF